MKPWPNQPFISLLVYVLPRPESYLCIGAGWENKGRGNGKRKQVNKGGEKARHCDLISPPAGYSVSDYVSLWHIVWNPQLISYRPCVPFLTEFSWAWEEPCSKHQSENSISSLSGGMYFFSLVPFLLSFFILCHSCPLKDNMASGRIPGAPVCILFESKSLPELWNRQWVKWVRERERNKRVCVNDYGYKHSEFGITLRQDPE